MTEQHAALLAGVLGCLRETIPGSPPLTPGTELLDSGLLDSLGIIEVVTALEARHRVEFPAHRLVPESFTDAATLTGVLAEVVAARPAEPSLCAERQTTAP